MAGTPVDTTESRGQDWTLRPMSPALGVEIAGIDLKAVDGGQAVRIGHQLNHSGALLFRGQDLTPHDLARFSRYFGTLDEAPVNEAGKTAIEGLPEIYVISNIVDAAGRAVGSLGAGEGAWHSDMSYLPQPPKYSVLYAVEIPPSGGDTWLAGMYGALDRLPQELRRRIAGRRIKHDATYNSAGLLRQGLSANQDPRTSPGTYHPAICHHPDTGRDVLYLGRRRNAYVESLTPAASECLLDDLWAHATQAAFCHAHTWRVGDVLMWDNRATLHRRDPFDAAARRYMLRTQIAGDSVPAARREPDAGADGTAHHTSKP